MTIIVVPQLCASISNPGDVNGCRAEAKDQTHKFIWTLEQDGWWFTVGHWGWGNRSESNVWRKPMELLGIFTLKMNCNLTKNILYTAFKWTVGGFMSHNTSISWLLVISLRHIQSAAHWIRAAVWILEWRTVNVTRRWEFLTILLPMHRDVRWEITRN